MSDPSVRQMTEAQWLFEYHALQAKERSWSDTIVDAFKAFFQELRASLISLFGLNLVKKWDTSKLSDEDKRVLEKETPFVPASFLWGRPEMLKAFLEEGEKQEIEEHAFDDKAFDEMSLRMARGEMNDLDRALMSIDYDPAPVERKLSLDRLAKAGVKFVRVNDPLLRGDDGE